ncbi:hypothetical protein [Frankia sp. ACN10a]|uniref:hypothetical protein n=1 Tax=Frankia sp. ACN10a TaxID=2926031 RepID=UPI00211794B5|nr:hypothetical protein [Frankia sp. ACN10a]
MNGPTGTVELDWALFSKRPGQRDDYTVIAASAARVRPASLAKMITYFAVGQPAGPAPGQPGALPWVTFTAATVSGTPYIGIAIKEWPAAPTTDATGRIIVPTRFFCLPEVDFHRELGSYLAFHDAVRDVAPDGLPSQIGTGLLALRVSRLDRRTVLASPAWEPVGAGRAASLRAALATAALLVERPVTLTPARVVDLRARVSYLDLTAAMLPAGAAGALAASTWADVRASQQVRLAFGDDLGAGEAARLDPARPPSLRQLATASGTGGATAAGASTIGATNAGGRYAAVLAHLVGASRSAPGGEDEPATERLLTGLVEALAADLTPRAFSRPQEFAEHLAVTAATSLAAAVRSGSRSPRDARGYLASMPVGSDPSQCLFPLLLDGPEPDDLRLALRQWPGPGVAGSTHPATALVRAFVGAGVPVGIIEERLTDAPTPVRAAVVAALLEPQSGETAPREDAVNLAAELIRGSQPGRDDDDWAAVRSRLLAAPELALLIVLRHIEARPGVGLNNLFRWLEPGPSSRTAGVLKPYRLLADKRPPAAADLTTLTLVDPAVVDRAMQALVSLAAAWRLPRYVLPAVGGWLETETQSGQLHFGPRRKEEWRALLERLDEERAERDRLLRLIGALPPKQSKSLLKGGKGRKAAPVTVALGWLGGTQAVLRTEDRALTELVLSHLPTVTDADPGAARSPGEPDATELSFAGDGAGVAVAIAYSASGGWRAGHTEFAPFVAAGGRLVEFCETVHTRLETGGEPGSMTLPGVADPLVVARLAGEVAAFGFAAVARVAARLLEGPVVIVTGPDRPPLRQRLTFLRAVFALLPAGVSASMTVATWAADPSPFRLAFTARTPSTDTTAVRWPPRPDDGLHGLAGIYADRLGWARALSEGTEPIVGQLAAMTDAVTLDDLADRLALVGGANQAFGPPGESRPVALATARERRRAILAGRADTVEAMVRALVVLLADGGVADVEAAYRLADRARQQGRLDDVLAALLRRSEADRERLARVHRGAVRLGLILPGEGLRLVLREALQATPAAAVRLLVQLDLDGRGPGELAEWSRWLRADGQLADLAAFDALLADQPASEAARTRAEAYGPDARALLQRLAPRESAVPAPPAARLPEPAATERSDAVPTEPAPTEPAPTEPAPTEPAPTGAVPGVPPPAEPAGVASAGSGGWAGDGAQATTAHSAGGPGEQAVAGTNPDEPWRSSGWRPGGWSAGGPSGGAGW